MRIALIQQRATMDKAANRAKGLENAEKAAQQGAQIICFAELAFEPFYPQNRAAGHVADLAETIPGPTTEAFAALARKRGVAIVLNIFERDGERTYDSSPVISSKGELLGEGLGVFAVGEKKMQANAALKMAEKRAMVDAVLNTLGIADLFSQDLEDAAAEAQPAPAADPAPDFLERQNVRAALAGLPARHREILGLRFYLDQSYEELAALLRLPLGTVKSRLHRARCALRDKLTDLVSDHDQA